MVVGDIVKTPKGKLGLIKEPYEQLKGAWYISIWVPHLGTFLHRALWEHQMIVVEENPHAAR